MLGFDLRRVVANNRFQNQFEDLGQIGSGGFSVVHRVRHRIDHRTYALKIISIKPSLSRDDNEELLYRTLAEPKAHASLAHPNILPYHGCWIQLQPYSLQDNREEESPNEPQFQMVLQDSYSSGGIVFGRASSESEKKSERKEQCERRGGVLKVGDGSALKDYKEIRVYLLSELCEVNLQNFIANRNCQRRNGGLVRQEVLQNYMMVLEMAAGLNYLHSKRIIHRDIKLHNVMLDREGRCRIIDFGLAKRVKYWKTSIEDTYLDSNRQEDERYSTSVGTKLFSSPEQAASEKYDYRTDIYSLGMIIALLFTHYTTHHQQRELLDKIRKRNLEEVVACSLLKTLIYRCLGPQAERPALGEVQKCIKDLMRSVVDHKQLVQCTVEERKEQVECQQSQHQNGVQSQAQILEGQSEGGGCQRGGIESVASGEECCQIVMIQQG